MIKSLLYSRKGAFDAKMGMDLGIVAIFVLAIGLSVAVETIDNLTLNGSGGTTGASLTGISATVIDYVPLIVIAVFIYGIARIGGVL